MAIDTETPEAETPDRDGAAVRLPPPLVYLGALLAGIGLQAFVLPLRIGLPAAARATAAAGLALVGLALLAGAMRLFRRTGQDPKPWKPTPEVIGHGVYRFSRNPMYVGLALLQAAIGLALANAWIVGLVPVVLAIVYATAVRHEEAYLERAFGETYAEYRRSVRRWL